jgi:hypothetical protein
VRPAHKEGALKVVLFFGGSNMYKTAEAVVELSKRGINTNCHALCEAVRRGRIPVKLKRDCSGHHIWTPAQIAVAATHLGQDKRRKKVEVAHAAP